MKYKSLSQERLFILIWHYRNCYDKKQIGTSKAIAEYMSLGDEYKKVKKVYSVNIVYFNLGQGSDNVYHGKTEFIGLHNYDILQLSKIKKKHCHIER